MPRRAVSRHTRCSVVGKQFAGRFVGTLARRRRSRARVVAISAALAVAMGFSPGATASTRLISTRQPMSWTVSKSTLSFEKIVCPTDRVCFAIGPGDRVAESSNGTKSWIAPKLNVSIVATLDIACPSASSCIVPADAGVLGKSPQPPRFLVSHNGAKSWMLVTPPKDVTGLGAISCPDVKHCLAVATTTSNTGEMLASQDGGLSWVSASHFSAPGFSQLYCRSASWCLRASGGYSDSGPIREITSITTNEGRTFSGSSTLASAEQINSIACSHLRNCIAVGSTFTQGTPGPDEGAAYASTNSGRSWRRIALPRSVATVSATACTGASRCVAAAVGFGSSAPTSSFGMLLGSTDAGATWSVSTQGTDVPSATVACIPSGKCVAGGFDLVAST